jgi:hypothetical protein
MWKANGKTTTLQLFLDSLSPKNMRNSSSGDKLKIALFGELSLEEAMDLSRDRQILELELLTSPAFSRIPFPSYMLPNDTSRPTFNAISHK